ncbi:hypothetical protein [Candidatus Spongiihabitans sp.]|uniref:hypothetical protein n=1 Tax=Candidatus Spongiihabitans sp. TaxID=3101308 RepID=UPI003C7006FF
MNSLKFAVVFIVVLVAGCITPQAPKLTPLEIQSLQSREYEETKAVVFPSVLSVFQDLGYIVKTADKDTGFITAESPTNNTTGFWDAFAGIAVNSQTIATAFVEEIGQITKIRLNIVAKKSTSSEYGQNSKQDTPILDAKVYQNAFERIESVLFIRSSN